MCNPVVYATKTATLEFVCDEHKAVESVMAGLGVHAGRISFREFSALYRDHIIDISLREVDVIGPTHMVIHQEVFRQNRTCMRLLQPDDQGDSWVTVYWEDGSGYNPRQRCKSIEHT